MRACCIVAYLIVLWGFVAYVNALRDTNDRSLGPFHKGMAFGGDVPTIPFDSADAVRSLQSVRGLGADWVCICFSWFQPNINSTVISPDAKKSPTSQQVASIVRNATAIGLKVLLKPHVDVLDGTWRAWIGTHFTEQDWNYWFASYYSYYLFYARIAEELKVEIYSLGVEMITATQHADQFRRLVEDTRRYYHGIVTYSANWGSKLQFAPQSTKLRSEWGGEIDEITWIDALDVIGLDAYYFITDKVDPSEQDLMDGWAPIVRHIGDIATTWNKSVIFTEIGYRSMEGAAVHPGWWNISAPVNLTQQALCYQAVFKSFIKESWWQGIHWWVWKTDPNAGGPNDIDFTPQNKPETLGVIKNYYQILETRDQHPHKIGFI